MKSFVVYGNFDPKELLSVGVGLVYDMEQDVLYLRDNDGRVCTAMSDEVGNFEFEGDCDYTDKTIQEALKRVLEEKDETSEI